MCPPMWAHWHHLANMIELVLPSAYPHQQPKRQIDRFGCFCTAHGKRSLYFTMADPLPQNCPFSWGSGPNLTRFLGSIRAHHPNGISIGSAVFVQMTADCPYTLQLDALPMRDLGPHLIHGSLGHPSPQPKLHLDRFSSFCRAHWCDRPTDRPTDNRPLFNSHLFVETA